MSTSPLDLLQQQACDLTSLSDFGDQRALELAGALWASYETEARLTRLGWRTVKGEVLGALVQRLLLVEALRRADPRPPVVAFVVLGLPRTGSTAVQHLLAAVPGLRAPVLQELLAPFPLPGVPDSRRDQALDYLRLLDLMAPGLRALHPMDVDLPEECITAMRLSFASNRFAVGAPVPSYWAKVRAADGWWYEEYAGLLSLLAGPSSGAWVLKAPAHAFHVAAMAAAFPDATLVQTHREPCQVVASYADLLCAARAGSCDGAVWEKVVQEVVDDWSAAMDGLLAWRLAAGRTVVDVHLAELSADPAGVLERCRDAAPAACATGAPADVAQVAQRARAMRLPDRPHRGPVDTDVVAAAFDRYRRFLASEVPHLAPGRRR